ncbi:glutamine amidotransferase [Rhodovulum adriaticum]|uniref:GMP synthase (Glutamine-hydrolysing) n=1 Tax=Rhodovulum adriaticum TaxID=35804 RepID=A0A4R2NM28_RHOAD|nr:glutamine amidotransferase [Rhodovulum adriaticum]MBK1635171.1 glutamine amidotransferase [Rhodovulum adriaticum]TCP22284.1 GMP synthase (glutamine-hydrolysing) [Rhodovulum adriaticum]
MKPFLVLQLRPETEASDDEFAAILRKGGLTPDQAQRIRLDQGPLPEGLSLDTYSGVIVGGGPGCVSDPADRKSCIEARIEDAVMGLMPEITARDLPFMGCCYGIGILAHHLGAPVTKERYSEPVGATTCVLTQAGRDDPLLAGVPDSFRAFVGHKEAVQALPAGCVHLLASEPCPYQMIRFGQNVYATQFHPEADSDGFEVRIRIYKDRGYFPPETAADLVAMCRAEDVHVPEGILQRFVTRYARD